MTNKAWRRLTGEQIYDLVEYEQQDEGTEFIELGAYQELEEKLNEANAAVDHLSRRQMPINDECAKLKAEVTRLHRVIAQELTENDELGCEYTYVNALKQEIAQLQDTLKIRTTDLHAAITECERAKALEKDHQDDWKRVQDAERQLERLKGEVELWKGYWDKQEDQKNEYSNACIRKNIQITRLEKQLAVAIKTLESLVFYGQLNVERPIRTALAEIENMEKEK